MGLLSGARRVVLILCVVVGSSISFSQSAGATALNQTVPGANDYPWQSASMNDMSPLRFAYRNCTDYVAYQLNKQLGGSLSDVKFDWSTINYGGNGNASAWRKGANGKFMVDQTPGLGSVAWWGSDRAAGYGHVALVTGVGADANSITVDEYNTDMAGHFNGGHVLTRGQAGWPESFIHVADVYNDGTFLNTEQGKVYVVAGGAALPLRDWDSVGGPKPTVNVLQRQVDGMPRLPHDGSYLRDGRTGIDYTVRDGKLHPVVVVRTATTEYGQDLGAWAAGYVSPGMAGGLPGAAATVKPVALMNDSAPTADAALNAITFDASAIDSLISHDVPQPATRLTLQ